MCVCVCAIIKYTHSNTWLKLSSHSADKEMMNSADEFSLMQTKLGSISMKELCCGLIHSMETGKGLLFVTVTVCVTASALLLNTEQ